MGLYKRGPTWWVSFAVPKELAKTIGITDRNVRESTGTGNKKEADAFYSRRKRELKEGTWRPASAGGAGITVSEYAARWTARRKAVGLRSAVRDESVLQPLLGVLGERRLTEVKRSHVREAVDAMRVMEARGRAAGRPYSSTSVHRYYGVLRSLFSSAVREELITHNPCSLSAVHNELPPREDADPRWRSRAVFSRAELIMLMTDERIPEVRRVLYALTFFGGLRLGEMAARTWGDYDASVEPLGRLQVETQHDGRSLKTRMPREVPVHPELAAVLAHWRTRYELTYREQPTDDSLIVRTMRGTRFGANGTRDNLQRDLSMLGLRPRRTHDLRRSFITIARADGASDLLKYVTHGASKAAIMDAYTSPPWETLCEQVAKIKLTLPTNEPGGNVVRFRRRKADLGTSQSTSQRFRKES